MVNMKCVCLEVDGDKTKNTHAKSLQGKLKDY